MINSLHGRRINALFKSYERGQTKISPQFQLLFISRHRMPRKYVRKTVQNYSEQDLQRALSSVKDDGESVANVSVKFNIPQRTIYGRLSEKHSDIGRGAKPILSKEEELLLVHTINLFQEWQQPLCRLSVIQIAKDYMIELKKNISKESSMYDWFECFMGRWKDEIKLANSMNLEKVRSKSCTPEVIGKTTKNSHTNSHFDHV